MRSIPLILALLASCTEMDDPTVLDLPLDDGPAVSVVLEVRDADGVIHQIEDRHLDQAVTLVARVEPPDGVNALRWLDRDLFLADAMPGQDGEFRADVVVDASWAGVRELRALPVRSDGIAPTSSAPVALPAITRLTTSGAREPLRRAQAIYDYLLRVRAGTEPFTAATWFTYVSTPALLWPPASATYFQASALTSLRHVVPSTLALLELGYALLDQVPEASACDRVALLHVMRAALVTLDESKEYGRKVPTGNIRIRQAMTGHAGATLLRARASLACDRPSYPRLTDALAIADRLQRGDAGTTVALGKIFSSTYAASAVDLRTDGSTQEGFGYSDFWLDAFVPAAVVLTIYGDANPFYRDLAPGSAANLRRFIAWREAAQRPDGTWTALNDSTGSRAFYFTHLVAALIQAAPADAPAAVRAEQPNLLRALRRMACVAPGGVASPFTSPVEVSGYLFPAATRAFTRLRCADQAPTTRAVYPMGGHAFAKDPSTGLMISLFNEGSFYRTDLATAQARWRDVRAEAEAPFADAAATNDFFQTSRAAYPLSFFEWAGEPARPWRTADELRSLRDFSWFETFLAAPTGMATACLGASGCGPVAPKVAGHNRADDTHVELVAFGKTLLFGAGFADYYTSWSPIHEFQGPTAYNVPMIDGRFPVADAQATDKVVELERRGGAALYRMPTGSHDRYVVSVGERFFLLFDRTRARGSEVTQELLHVRGARTASTYTSSQGLAFSRHTIRYDEQLTDGTAKPGSRDDRIRLHVFPGLPNGDVSARDEWHADSCDDVSYLPSVPDRGLGDYCRHRALVLDPVPARTVHALPILLWPEREGAAGDLARIPTVDWTLGTRLGVIHTYTLRVRYQRSDGTQADERFTLPADPAVPISSLSSLGR